MTKRRRTYSFFRSEVMYLCRLYLRSESAYSCLAELGELGLVQFIEGSELYQNPSNRYYGEIQRCEELELIIKYLKNYIQDNNIKMPEIIIDFPSPSNKEISDIDNNLHNLSEELNDVTQNYDILKKNYSELIELKEVILECDIIFNQNNSMSSILSDTQFKHLNNETKLQFQNYDQTNPNLNENKLSYFTGVIPRKKCINFEKMLWRICYGNYYIKLTEIDGNYEDSYTKEKNIKKNLFIIFFHGDAIKIKIKKILDAFHATQYVCPENSVNRKDMLYDINMKVQDLETIISETEDHRLRLLKASANTIDLWSNKINKYKSIYHILNIMDMDETKKMYFAEVWLPRDDLLLINKAIQRGTQKFNLPSPPLIEKIRYDSIPPTYIRTNRFTKGFQALINAYGLALYRELNPAPYTIITFPFLFGVMFGDMGHGLLLIIFAYWMIYYEKQFLLKKSNNEIWNIFFGGRYIIFLMGIFSVYTGAIYNDMFSKALNIFGTKWRINYNVSTVMENEILQLNPGTSDYLKSPYEFGLDPIWDLSENTIIMTNSLKMKVSIILGVLQMVFGLILSAVNHHYFSNKLSMILEFLPQLIFLNFLFTYLVILIFIKWYKYSCDNDTNTSESCAPSILNLFIDMMMFKVTPPKDKNCDNIMFENEHKFQLCLVIVAFTCIPILFFGKPIFVYLRRLKAEKERVRKLNLYIEKKRLQERSLTNDNIYINQMQNQNNDPSILTQIPAELFDDNDHMDEVVIHQGIHTIESVLGSVSHTASYLRLWALSLAHSQLSSVLWDMVFQKGLKSQGPLAPLFITIAFSFWAVLTVSILVLMEGLSAFLHALRLHWVEFQSKFYLGSGYVFQPFYFQRD